jgi:hypothetical protein
LPALIQLASVSYFCYILAITFFSMFAIRFLLSCIKKNKANSQKNGNWLGKEEYLYYSPLKLSIPNFWRKGEAIIPGLT